jgi:hypothetical protein
MTVADEIPFNHSRPANRSFDKLIAPSYVVFAIIFLALICAASTTSGTSSGEIASMSDFP